MVGPKGGDTMNTRDNILWGSLLAWLLGSVVEILD